MNNDVLHKLKSFREDFLKWICNIESIRQEIEKGKIFFLEDYSVSEFREWKIKSSSLLEDLHIEHKSLENNIKSHLKYSEILESMVEDTFSDFIYHSAQSDKKLLFLNAKIHSLIQYSRSLVDTFDIVMFDFISVHKSVEKIVLA